MRSAWHFWNIELRRVSWARSCSDCRSDSDPDQVAGPEQEKHDCCPSRSNQSGDRCSLYWQWPPAFWSAFGSACRCLAFLFAGRQEGGPAETFLAQLAGQQNVPSQPVTRHEMLRAGWQPAVGDGRSEWRASTGRPSAGLRSRVKIWSSFWPVDQPRCWGPEVIELLRRARLPRAARAAVFSRPAGQRPADYRAGRWLPDYAGGQEVLEVGGRKSEVRGPRFRRQGTGDRGTPFVALRGGTRTVGN